jgi:ribonuclease P protein component
MVYKLPKKIILRNNREFQCVYRHGKSYANKYMVLYVLKGGASEAKAGFAAGKRLGNAVTRNRAKRLLREAFRLNRAFIKDGVQLILVGRNPIVDLKYQAVEKAFNSLCRKAEIFDK